MEPFCCLLILSFFSNFSVEFITFLTPTTHRHRRFGGSFKEDIQLTTLDTAEVISSLIRINEMMKPTKGTNVREPNEIYAETMIVSCVTQSSEERQIGFLFTETLSGTNAKES